MAAYQTVSEASVSPPLGVVAESNTVFLSLVVSDRSHLGNGLGLTLGRGHREILAKIPSMPNFVQNSLQIFIVTISMLKPCFAKFSVQSLGLSHSHSP
jgi:hypothetical protein